MTTKQRIFLFFCLIAVIAGATLFFTANPVLAQDPPPQETSVWRGMSDTIRPIGVAFGYPSGVPTDVRVIAFLIIRIFLGILSTIFIVLIVYGGYMYMTSQGEQDKVQKAKGILRTGIIGIIIIFSAWSIGAFVLRALVCAVSEYGQWCLFFTGY